MGRPKPTVHGNNIFDVISAFQKSVRRGNLDDALYFAADLHLSGFGGYLWKRMLVICTEDIGLADRNLPATMWALYQMNLLFKKEKRDGPQRMLTVQAVALLCTAPKSRMNDHAQMVHWRTHDARRRDIPDYAFDRHTSRGQRMGRGSEFFFDISTILHPKVSAGDRPHPIVAGEPGYVRDDYEDEARKIDGSGIGPSDLPQDELWEEP